MKYNGAEICAVTAPIQRMRELALLDKARGHKKDAVTSKREEEGAQQAENVEETDHWCTHLEISCKT